MPHSAEARAKPPGTLNRAVAARAEVLTEAPRRALVSCLDETAGAARAAEAARCEPARLETAFESVLGRLP